MSPLPINLDAEQEAFDKEVAAIEAWWRTPRQAHLKRPYSAKRIAMIRNSFPIEYPSSRQALKLWNQLNEHMEKGTFETTFGVNDPVIVAQMAKHFQTVYCSGAMCGFSQVAEPGMDQADYPWDTVPKVVDKIFRSQMWHDRRQHQFRMLSSKEDRVNLDSFDYMQPIVADADMGFGGLSSTIKMAKLFVESGVAMIHMDDLAIGMKRFTIGQGRTIVPVREYLGRFTAARMQFDAMGAETMLLCRTDLDHAEFITSVIDHRDHEYVIGATLPVPTLVETINKAQEEGDTDLVKIRAEWKKTAGLKTFDQAVKDQATEEQFKTYTAVTPYPTSLAQRRIAAKEVLGKDVAFDWDSPRSREGQYMFEWTIKGCIERAIAVAPLGDITWARMDTPNIQNMKDFFEGVRAVFPKRMFAFGYTGSFDWSKAGYTQAQVESFPSDIASMGVVWQVQPIWAAQGLPLVINKFAKSWKDNGIAGYVEDVQKPALAGMKDGAPKMSYGGAHLTDYYFEIIGARDKQ